jgi:hypothetical protein
MGGRDLYLDVNGSSSLGVLMWTGLPRGGAAAKAVARKLSSYRNILRVQPPSVVLRAFAYESLGGCACGCH